VDRNKKVHRAIRAGVCSFDFAEETNTINASVAASRRQHHRCRDIRAFQFCDRSHVHIQIP
jgi:hypothetical protein